MKSGWGAIDHDPLAREYQKHAQAHNEREKMIQSFVMTIIGVGNQHQHLANSQMSTGGKTFEKIFSMLTTVYMPNAGLTQEALKDVMQSMMLDNKITLSGNKYFTI